MRRNLGATTGLIALLALAVHSVNPPAGESRNSSSGSGQDDTTRGKNSKDQDKSENAREGPWLATQAFFGPSGGMANPSKDDELKAEVEALASSAVSPKDAPTLRNLFGTAPSICSGTGSYSLVATVADPAHTRLALFFDGQIDSIERAAQSDGWVFARQWLPWIDAFDASDHDIDARREQRRLEREQEVLPGILVFRPNGAQTPDGAQVRPNGCLFVLLVPETPTGGIAEDSFFAALNIADLLSPETKIGLLAPSFSGSFPSLSHAVSAWQKRHQLRLYPTAYGGSVSSRRAALAFHESTLLNFLSGIPSDLDVAAAFRDLMDKYGLGSESSAYLVEQESGFGVDAADAVHFMKTSGPSAVVYEFPRDISHLRNAYQRASPGNSGHSESPIPSIQLSLNDPSRGEDSIPVFSDTSTPVVQSAALGTITEDLVRRGVRVAYISATNSLDELFLAQFLRQQCPNIRVVIAGDTDLLFLPAAAQRSLAGTLFLSPYPMFFEGDKALSSNPQATRYSLLSGNLEGLFNVTRLLLWHIQRGPKAPTLRSYGAMKPNNDAYPGLWLLELTRFGFSPIDWVDVNNLLENDQSRNNLVHWMESNPMGQIAGELPRPMASPGWYITSRLTGLGIVAGFIIFLCLNRTNRISWPVWRGSTGETTIRFPLFAGACLFISSLPWILGIPFWFELDNASWRQNATLVLLGLAFVTPLTCLLWIAAKRIYERRRPPLVWYLDPLAPLLLFLYLFVLIGWWRLCDGSDASHAMFRWRSLHLYSSSSPAVPMLLICVILAVGLMAEFYRRSDTGRTSPHLKIDPIKGIPAFRAYYSETDQLIGGQLKFTRFVTGALATAVSMLLLWRYLAAFEVEQYNWGLKIFVAVLIWALASLGHDAVLIWFNLSKMLALIESIPLRSVFTRIARAWPRRQVWAFWKSTPRQALAVQMSAALHNLSKAGTDKQKDLAISFFGLTRDRFAGTPEVNFKDFSGTRLEYRQYKKDAPNKYSDARLNYEGKAADAAEELFFAELWPTWEASPIDDQAAEESKGTISAKEHRFAADFVALQCCNYFTHAVRQTQRIVWTISFLLVLLIALLNSYAAQGPQFIGRYLVVLFVAAGCIVVYVFAGMERNWILSQISHTKPGELNAEFWLHIGALGALPLIGLAVHLFPELATFLYSWVAPGVESLK